MGTYLRSEFNPINQSTLSPVISDLPEQSAVLLKPVPKALDVHNYRHRAFS